MNTPLIRTLEQAEAFEREKQAAERRHLIALAVRRGWISFPNAESDTPAETKNPRLGLNRGREAGEGFSLRL
jgi:hypothetical protein